MPNRLTCLLVGLTLTGAAIGGAPRIAAEAQQLDALIDRFVKLRGSSSGGIVAGAAQRLTMFQELRQTHGRIPSGRLTPEQQIDWMALKGQIAGTIHELETLRPWERDAERFIQFGAVAAALAQEEGAMDARASRVVERLGEAIARLQEARLAVKTPSRLFTEGAIYQSKEWLTFLRTDLAAFARSAGDARPQLESANAAAIVELAAFIEYLEKDLLPRSSCQLRHRGRPLQLHPEGALVHGCRRRGDSRART
jgi:hypothetical protein